MAKVGIFGSSFNPIHIGHLIMADQALERLKLDKILLVPTKNPYHKKVEMLDFEYRSKMAVIEAEFNDKMEVSFVEKDIVGQSYTFDVLDLLKTEYPDDDFYFIIGSDSLLSFDRWYKSEELLRKCSFVVFQRPEDEDASMLASEYKDKGMDIYYFNDLQLEISSSFIRDSIKNNKSVKYLLTDRTINYIKENGLYE